jgi:uncharacterized protein YgbK (DUF1537 family)
MAEADLRLHLAQQTSRRTGLIDLVALRAGQGPAQLLALQNEDAPVVLLDVLDEETLLEAGRLVWEQRGDGLFSASSSGLQYALAAYWRSQGWLPAASTLPVADRVAAIAVVSGSCSPVTAQQIAWAAANGFQVQTLDLARLLDAHSGPGEVAAQVEAAVAELGRGLSPLVCSAQGPDDPGVRNFDPVAAAAGLSREQAAARVGEGLAEILRALLVRVPLPRVAVAGGDSSGAVTSALDIDALTVAAGLAPGVPLCQAWSASSAGKTQVQIALKGGQLGGLEFFGSVRDGR